MSHHRLGVARNEHTNVASACALEQASNPEMETQAEVITTVITNTSLRFPERETQVEESLP